MDPISALAPTDSSAARTNAFSELNSEEFMRIMFAELAHQDPLKPNDSAQMVEQMANIRSIQSDIDLSAKLKALVTENQLASAGNLIGAYISGLSDSNERVEGLVISISRTADGPVLNLSSGARVALRRVDEVIDPRFLEPIDPGPAPTEPDPDGDPSVRPPHPGPTPTEPDPDGDPSVRPRPAPDTQVRIGTIPPGTRRFGLPAPDAGTERRVIPMGDL